MFGLTKLVGCSSGWWLLHQPPPPMIYRWLAELVPTSLGFLNYPNDDDFDYYDNDHSVAKFAGS